MQILNRLLVSSFTRDRSLSNLTTLFSDWLILQEENSSCNFGALQVITVVRTGVYYHQTGNEKRTTFRKSTTLPGWDASPSQGYPRQYFFGTHLYPWVEKDWGKNSCLRKQHDGRDWVSNHRPSDLKSNVLTTTPVRPHFITTPVTCFGKKKSNQKLRNKVGKKELKLEECFI